MRISYFGSRYFAASFFAASGDEAAPGGYFGSEYFAANYFGAGFYGPVTLSGAITAILDATESADTLTSSATAAVQNEVVSGSGMPWQWPTPRFDPITADLDVKERGDTCESTVTLGFDPVAMDNDWLLVAA